MLQMRLTDNTEQLKQQKEAEQHKTIMESLAYDDDLDSDLGYHREEKPLQTTKRFESTYENVDDMGDMMQMVAGEQMVNVVMPVSFVGILINMLQNSLETQRGEIER